MKDDAIYHKLFLGSMDLECPKCHALHWRAEKLSKSSFRNPKFGACCKSGKIELPYLQKPPVEQLQLFTREDYHSKHFLENICSYNAAFAFVSLGMKTPPQNDPELPQTGVHQFKVRGELYHSLGSLLPEGDKNPVYAQLYIMTPETALEKRMANNAGSGLQPDLMSVLDDCLHRHNQFYGLYKSAHEHIAMLEQEDSNSLPIACVRLHFSEDTDGRR